ncbi:GlcG/HbpS family heme-binding protein [Methyloferula stellata]|uniref:GlcG/HbpS family heme-binding protein n=1 Tax=Methyloferula stellata TaxID=876270 RepID=UPI00035E5963|nr:heme-binding protein [Methyloferula stellata]
MARASLGFVIGLTMIAGCGAAFAQASTPLPSQAPVPEQMPFNIPIGRSIDLAKAKELAGAAETEAAKRHWKMAISIVDPSGELVYFEKMDDTQFASIQIAQAKARTAARFRRPTSAFYDAIETGHPSIAVIDPTLVGIPGGLPLVENGKLIGGIGCSGGASVQDAVICKAGADKLQ